MCSSCSDWSEKQRTNRHSLLLMPRSKRNLFREDNLLQPVLHRSNGDRLIKIDFVALQLLKSEAISRCSDEASRRRCYSVSFDSLSRSTSPSRPSFFFEMCRRSDDPQQLFWCIEDRKRRLDRHGTMVTREIEVDR